MRRSGERILELAALLKNAQLRGQGHEVLGNAAHARGDADTAAREWRDALQEFHRLGQDRDELRVLGALLRLPTAPRTTVAEVQAPLLRYLELQARVDDTERRRTAQDLDTRLKYAQQKLDLARLQNEAALSNQRESALREHQRLADFVALLGALVALVLAASFYAQRRSNRRLARAFAQLGESEARYRTLAENSRDLVVRMRLDGKRLYISPSVREMLGYAPEELLEPRWELVHAEDRARLAGAIGGLKEVGDTASVTYRILRSDGEYAWLEALAQRVTSPTGDGDEIVYTARDISERVRAERALELSEARLRAVTDNMPALITYVDPQERYVFSNAPSARLYGLVPEKMIGRTVREVRGEETYRTLQPHIAAALSGERQQFEGEAVVGGKHYWYESIFVPDCDAQGVCRGFYSLISDVTRRKLAELELDRLARIDSLTGIANRRQFEEAFAGAIARAQRHARPLALLYLDIDRFKSINDNLGHQIGDAVIRAFAARLQLCLRQEDLLARLGGDEFVVVLQEVPRAEDAATVARKIVEAMHLPLPLGDTTLSISTSIGVAFARSPRDAGSLVALADRALYAAKEAGRNGWKLLEQSASGTAAASARHG
jgi:diguanylate cyclase (GGDEF)-like protein/PAS domain S-box-containing protein